jgi:hypothetical protein
VIACSDKFENRNEDVIVLFKGNFDRTPNFNRVNIIGNDARRDPHARLIVKVNNADGIRNGKAGHPRLSVDGEGRNRRFARGWPCRYITRQALRTDQLRRMDTVIAIVTRRDMQLSIRTTSPERLSFIGNSGQREVHVLGFPTQIKFIRLPSLNASER